MAMVMVMVDILDMELGELPIPIVLWGMDMERGTLLLVFADRREEGEKERRRCTQLAVMMPMRMMTVYPVIVTMAQTQMETEMMTIGSAAVAGKFLDLKVQEIRIAIYP
jgi:hypothetical protein